MVITIASWKGGVGKSTTAIHLAHFFEDYGSTLLVDTDPNRTALRWAEDNTSRGFKVITDAAIAKEAPHFQNILVDTPARPESLDLQGYVDGSDLVIIPCTPSMYALSTLHEAEQSIRLLNPNSIRVLLTDVPTGNQKDGFYARTTLEEMGYHLFQRSIRHAKAFKHAESRSAFVRDVHDGGPAYEAWLDYVAVGKEIVQLLEMPTPTDEQPAAATEDTERRIPPPESTTPSLIGHSNA